MSLQSEKYLQHLCLLSHSHNRTKMIGVILCYFSLIDLLHPAIASIVALLKLEDMFVLIVRAHILILSQKTIKWNRTVNVEILEGGEGQKYSWFTYLPNDASTLSTAKVVETEWLINHMCHISDVYHHV